MRNNPCYYFIQEQQLPYSQVPLSALTHGQGFAAWSANGKQGRWGWMYVSFMDAYGQHLDIYKSSQVNGDHSSSSPPAHT